MIQEFARMPYVFFRPLGRARACMPRLGYRGMSTDLTM